MDTQATGAGYDKISDPGLLEKIDKLFAHNVGDLIELPQLVVVGDQSSGKSSVLAGLTKLPFPRDSGLCTRFATQITFRRSAEKRIKVSIIPRPNASEAHATQVTEWGTSISEMSADSFAKILSDASKVMGISSQGESGASGLSTFSEDVLRLEISGPNEDHLSIIDVPGIFKTTTDGVTTKEDIQTVLNMVRGYMKNRRSVMITVVPANVDIATQEILEMARELDPSGERTIGVLTKPDLVDEGAENKILDILRGKTQSLKLGWNVVRNPGQKDLDGRVTGRTSEDSFFCEKAPWNAVEKDKVGIEALRTRLQDILNGHIRREFPKVRSDVGRRLEESRASLRALGADRGSQEQQRAFLLDLITRFQEAVTQALHANYSANDLFEERPYLRLATLLVDREARFAEHLTKRGQEYIFGDEEAESEDEEVPPEPISIRSTPDPPELEDILKVDDCLHMPKEDILPWIKQVYRSSRGFEMGTFNQHLLPGLMKKQSKKWGDLALGYISDAVALVHTFIVEVLRCLCPEEKVRQNLISCLMDELLSRYIDALEQVNFLVFVQNNGFARTENPDFNQRLKESRERRSKSRMTMDAITDCSHGTVVKVEDVRGDSHPMNSIEQAVEDLHDLLQSYYSTSRERFIDSVILQAGHYHLLTGPKTPFKLLSPSYVQNLSHEQLETIAGEDANLRRRREQLKREIADLEVARKILL